MPGQHGAFPGVVLCLNFNVSIFPLAYRGQRVYVVLGYRGHKKDE